MRRFLVAAAAAVALDLAWGYLPLLPDPYFPWPFVLIGLAVTAVGGIQARSLRGGLVAALGAIAGTMALFLTQIALYVTEEETGDYIDPECKPPRREVISEIMSRPENGTRLDEIYSSTVRSPDLPGVRYVAIVFRIDGAVRTGVWATDWRTSTRVILAVDDEAERLTTWPDAEQDHPTIASDRATTERAKACTV